MWLCALAGRHTKCLLNLPPKRWWSGITPQSRYGWRVLAEDSCLGNEGGEGINCDLARRESARRCLELASKEWFVQGASSLESLVLTRMRPNSRLRTDVMINSESCSKSSCISVTSKLTQ